MHGKKLILIGGGHAHVQVLHALGRANVSLTLVSDVTHSPYSGMLPGHLTGTCLEQDLVFDLKAICDRYGHRFFARAVAAIDHSEKSLVLSDGQVLSYDICSLNVGILPQPIFGGSTANVISVKPISNFLSQWREVTRELPTTGSIIVVGGGAAAFELAIACGIRFPGRVSLVTGERGLTLPRGSTQLARCALKELDVELLEGQRVEKIEQGNLLLSRATKSFVLTIVATTARSTELVQHSLLPKGFDGHVVIDDFLRVRGTIDLFAVGDCAHFEAQILPKAGVYAVRQGPILAHNLMSSLLDRHDFKKFVPQKNILSILISGSNEAILCWCGFALRTTWAASLKRWIDLKFMQKFS